ncbi:MAG: 50S ribosomal protein L11 methyltransferase [Solirubrobacterales bacterium]
MIRLALRCRAEVAEQVLAELLVLAPSGVEEVAEPDGRRGVVEYAVYGASGELPELGEIEAFAGGALVEVSSEQVPEDWAERWKRFYFPVLVAGKLYVRPPWEQPAVRGGVHEIVIDPGLAFGTGTHATTRMCLELLLEARSASCRRLVEPGLARLVGRDRPGSFADLGCGSAVLSIAAAKLGFDPVLGVDADRAALEEAARNAYENRVEIRLECTDLRREAVPVADVVAANLTAPLLESVATRWAGSGQRPGIAIVSGVLHEEADQVARTFQIAGLDEWRRLVVGEWVALMLSQ